MEAGSRRRVGSPGSILPYVNLPIFPRPRRARLICDEPSVYAAMTEPQETELGLELVVEPRSERFDETDARWRQQVNALVRDLRHEVGGLRTESATIPGAKGATTDVILALGSSGALTAAVTMFKAWLDRDKTRVLDLEWMDGEQPRRLSIRATDVDEDTFDELVRIAARRELGGA
jgi:Effector Associated Constant Component 1